MHTHTQSVPYFLGTYCVNQGMVCKYHPTFSLFKYSSRQKVLDNYAKSQNTLI